MKDNYIKHTQKDYSLSLTSIVFEIESGAESTTSVQKEIWHSITVNYCELTQKI